MKGGMGPPSCGKETRHFGTLYTALHNTPRRRFNTPDTRDAQTRTDEKAGVFRRPRIHKWNSAMLKQQG